VGILGSTQKFRNGSLSKKTKVSTTLGFSTPLPQKKLPEKPLHKEPTSFPRRRESILKFQKLILFNSLPCSKMAFRLRGNDGRFGFYWWFMKFCKGFGLYAIYRFRKPNYAVWHKRRLELGCLN
ncbi:hypothetical protein, partial [Neisseria weixii]|uniref:hypothetical protein n=1 Tax=Neisseria weixii TaxID=1853276 RepID=UPI00359F89D4